MEMTRRTFTLAGLALPIVYATPLEANMSQLNIARILEAWNAPDEETRRSIVEATTTADLTYDDVHKRSQSNGQSAFLEFLTFFRSRVNDVQMTLDGDPEVLAGAARLRFALIRDDTVFSRGTYFATLSDDGRISSLFGFMDQEPS